jgi:hypothetical protein
MEVPLPVSGPPEETVKISVPLTAFTKVFIYFALKISIMHQTGRPLLMIACMASFVLFSCHSNTSQEESQNNTAATNKPASIAPFNADSAYGYVQKQVAFGPRIPNTPAHDDCAAWMIAEMRSFADSVSVQRTPLSTHGKTYRCINIIGHFNPKSATRILLLAHWDTRAFADADKKTRDQHFDGADDGASGVGVLLEIARQLHRKAPAIGVDIFFTDVEDAGLEGDDSSWGLGTQYWSRKAKASGYRAQYGILLDMVGGKGAHFYRGGFTKQYAGPQSTMVWNVANNIGYSDYFRYTDLGDVRITDDHVFVNQITGIPTMDIIALQGNGDFMPWHHTVNDNMSIIDKNTLKAVGQTVLQVLYTNPSY